MTCAGFEAACADTAECCTGLTCRGDRCRVDCAATLEAAGCVFVSGLDVWNCGSQDLTGITLSGCDLANASFFDANATGVTFDATNLTGANFFAATVTGAGWNNTTCPTGVNSDANGDTCCGQFILGQTPTGCGT